MLTVRILEEKNKMVEIMNEANNLYDRASAYEEGQRMSLKQSAFMKDDLASVIKPEYLD